MPVLYGTEIASPLMLGTAQYPSPAILAEAFRASGAGIATVSLRREAGGGQDFLLRETGAATLEDLAGRLKRAVEAAGAIIDGAIGVAGETANGPAGGRA